MDHMRRGTLNLEHVRFFVLDEADEMLDMGFIEDIEWILEQAPAERQTALFSATMPPRIVDLAARYMRDPQRITRRRQADDGAGDAARPTTRCRARARSTP